MGCTKRIANDCLLAALGQMRSVSVRFGNVLGSQAVSSPLPGADQDSSPDIGHRSHVTRYFMTIPELSWCCRPSLSRQGDILVLDMGKPVRILDMAKTLIRLSAYRWTR